VFVPKVDAKELIKRLSDVEKRQFPFALATAINDTAFQDVQKGWKDEIPRVFDSPTPFTLNAVQVKKVNFRQAKASGDFSAEIFLRDEASKGTPPVRYLAHGVTGGTRKRKPFENDLIGAGVMSAGEFAVPAKGLQLDSHGNVPNAVIRTMLSDLQASKDATRRSTRESRARRARRKKGPTDVYFYWPGDQGTGRSTHALPRGIYRRRGYFYEAVFFFVQSVSYEKRFDAYGLAERLFNAGFPRRFREAMARAMASRKR
jgi:hypothetical protein